MKNLDSIIKRVIKESHGDRSSRYMFFSNLEQMRRQCDLLLDLDHDMVESIEARSNISGTWESGSLGGSLG